MGKDHDNKELVTVTCTGVWTGVEVIISLTGAALRASARAINSWMGEEEDSSLGGEVLSWGEEVSN